MIRSVINYPLVANYDRMNLELTKYDGFVTTHLDLHDENESYNMHSTCEISAPLVPRPLPLSSVDVTAARRTTAIPQYLPGLWIALRGISNLAR